MMSSSSQTSVPASSDCSSKLRQHPQPHLVAHRQFHRAGLQHLGAERGQFQHLLEGDAVQLAGLVADARVGGVDPVHVGVDVAAFRAEGGGKGDGGGVRPAAAQRGDPAFGADPLEPGDDRDLHAFGELALDVVGRDVLDPGRGMGRGGLHRHLPALPGLRAGCPFPAGSAPSARRSRSRPRTLRRRIRARRKAARSRRPSRPACWSRRPWPRR